MPAALRFEIFPSNLTRCVDFYTTVLRFSLRRHEPEAGYAYMQRDGIRVGAAVKTPNEFPDGEVRKQYRTWPTGVELIFEVDNLQEEREWILAKGWCICEDLKQQSWGLWDFRVKDPDGYYIRITTPGVIAGADRS